MKVLPRGNSVQVLDSGGHLIRSFPTEAEAIAFTQGFARGSKEAVAMFREATAAMLAVVAEAHDLERTEG